MNELKRQTCRTLQQLPEYFYTNCVLLLLISLHFKYLVLNAAIITTKVKYVNGKLARVTQVNGS